MAINERSTLGELLKIIYEPALNEAIKNEQFFFNSVTKSKYDGKGKNYTFATHLKRNTAVSARGANDYFAAAGLEGVVNGSVNVAYVHMPFELSNDLIKAAKSDKAAFKDGMKLVVDTSKTTMSRDLNRMALGDQTGILATIAGGGITYTGGTTTNVTVTVDSTKFLEDGMLLDGYAAAATTNRALVGSTAPMAMKCNVVLSDTTFQLTMADWNGSTGTAIAAGLVATSVFIRRGNAYDTGSVRASYEPNGLALLAGTSDIHGITGANYSRWKAVSLDHAGVASGVPSPATLTSVAIKFRQKSSTMYNTIWGHPKTIHSILYSSGVQTGVRYSPAEAANFGAASYEDVVINVGNRKVRVKTDIDCPESVIYFFDAGVLRYVELNGIELEDLGDGNYLTLWRDSTGAKPSQVGYWMWRGNFATVDRSGLGRVYGCAAAAGTFL